MGGSFTSGRGSFASSFNWGGPDDIQAGIHDGKLKTEYNKALQATVAEDKWMDTRARSEATMSAPASPEGVLSEQARLADESWRRSHWALDPTSPQHQTFLDEFRPWLEGYEIPTPYAYDDGNNKPYMGGAKKGRISIGPGLNLDDDPTWATNHLRAAGLTDKQAKDARVGDYQLSKTQMDALGDNLVQDKLRLVRSKFTDDEWSKVNMGTAKAMVSLAYNGVLGPNVLAAIKSGDKRAAVSEILYNSGTQKSGKNRGLLRRRRAEAEMILGAAAWRDPKYRQELAEYAEAIPFHRGSPTPPPPAPNPVR